MANITHDVVAVHFQPVWVHGAGLSGKEQKNAGKKVYLSSLASSEFVNQEG
jgi:hypothetical protein